MTPRGFFLFSKNGSSILMQLVLITFGVDNIFYTDIYIKYIFKIVFKTNFFSKNISLSLQELRHKNLRKHQIKINTAKNTN